MLKSGQNEVQDFFYLDKIWQDPNRNSLCQEKSLHNEIGDFKTIYIHESDTLAIREYHSLYHEDCTLKSIVTESRYVEMSFFMHAHSIKDLIDGKPNEYQPYRGYVYFVPKGADLEVTLEKHKNYRHVDIYLEIGHLEEWMTTHSFVKKFVEDVRADRATHLFPAGIPICPDIANLLLDIKANELDKISQEYFIKGKIYLLLSLLFQKALNTTDPNPRQPLALREGEQKKLEQIAQLLAQNLDKFYSTEFLAKEFGVNEFKLKKGFKQRYEMGLFEYAIKLKMDHAKELIGNRNHTFKEIAYLLGYSAPSSFSVAFKRATGLSPIQYSKGVGRIDRV